MLLITRLFSEFDKTSWLSTFVFITILNVSFTVLLFLLKLLGVESSNEKKASTGFFASISMSTNLCLRAFVKMAPENNWTSITYKIILFFTLLCGFITFSHYEAIFASTLIVESEVLPYKSWDDVSKSDKLIFVYKDSIVEDMFIYAPSDHPISKIYHEKVKVVPPDLILNKIGEKGTIPYIISGEYLAFSNANSYKEMEQYPCEIKTLESVREITYVDFNSNQIIDLDINSRAGLIILWLFHLPRRVHF